MTRPIRCMIDVPANNGRPNNNIHYLLYDSGINITIVLGAHDLSQSSGLTKRTYNVPASAVTTHPDWNYGDVENDISLIQLPEDVSLSGIIRMTKYPRKDELFIEL